MCGEVSWLPPCCESRVGAAHRRRGTPCQDASGLWWFADADGELLQALVVSDGHGSPRYDRSAVGSRLACEVTLQAIASELASSRIGASSDLEPWREWLAHGLPEAVVKGWRKEVLHHGQAHPRADGAPPSTLAYGATLGVLVLTPRWWGYTGLGDWDLVRTGSTGPGELLSEEPASPGGGEATFSLCMEGAEQFFSCRSGLVPIEAGQEPFTLLLSTDGIRKSCGSDVDFLNLARHLGELPQSHDQGRFSTLAEALDHISSQGSGDDVSVAIARWGQPMDAPPLPAPWNEPLIVQPTEEAPLQPAGLESQPGDGALGPSEDRLCASDVSGKPGQGNQRGSLFWIALPLLVLALLAAGAGAMSWLGWYPFARREPVVDAQSPELMAVLQKEASRLCTPIPMPEPVPEATGAGGGEGSVGGPTLNAALLERINATLGLRTSTFRALLNGSPPRTFLRTPMHDPTGALIAWSRLHGQGQGPREMGWCPELRQALIQQWERVSLR